MEKIRRSERMGRNMEKEKNNNSSRGNTANLDENISWSGVAHISGDKKTKLIRNSRWWKGMGEIIAKKGMASSEFAR